MGGKTKSLTARVARLEAELAAVVADRAKFIRHPQTLARHMRRILGDNKRLRIENHERFGVR